MEKTYKGIDYGLGETNIDKKTGIRFGVIHQTEVLQAWADSSEPVYACEDCDYEIGDDDCSMADCEPLGYRYDEEGYFCTVDYYGDIFIEKSPYFTRAQFCSPCAPGACYLSNPIPNGEKAYCLGHDWFESEKAPYPVYSVETGKEVNP